MYLIDDRTGWALAAKEAVAIGHAAMALTLAHTLLCDRHIPSEIDVVADTNIEDAISLLTAEKETRLQAIAEYEARTGVNS
tara:strand:+ start:353 stop:595 length:243 start_codon:yes stop_codon:yes gene_type:complete